MNGEMLHEEAGFLAKRLSGNRAAQIRQAFELILGRPAKEEEVSKLAGDPRELEAVCRILLNSNEFLYVD